METGTVIAHITQINEATQDVRGEVDGTIWRIKDMPFRRFAPLTEGQDVECYMPEGADPQHDMLELKRIHHG